VCEWGSNHKIRYHASEASPIPNRRRAAFFIARPGRDGGVLLSAF
jgi:hypothetical protein